MVGLRCDGWMRPKSPPMICRMRSEMVVGYSSKEHSHSHAPVANAWYVPFCWFVMPMSMVPACLSRRCSSFELLHTWSYSCSPSNWETLGHLGVPRVPEAPSC